MAALVRKISNGKYIVVSEDGKAKRSSAGIRLDGGGTSQAAANRLRDRINSVDTPARKTVDAPSRLGKAIVGAIRRRARGK